MNRARHIRRVRGAVNVSDNPPGFIGVEVSVGGGELARIGIATVKLAAGRQTGFEVVSVSHGIVVAKKREIVHKFFAGIC